MINFQKYSDCIIRPGPYMNMIIGPNGTGKSTIVAAIALGLGSSPSVVGRSKNSAEFIKYKTSQATIELVLKSENVENSISLAPFVVIKRIMRRVSEFECSSDWFINGNAVNQQKVIQLAQELGVQISNLCQFLPQDKVSEFAQMSPEQMLITTMTATSSEETCKQYEQLLQKKKEERKLNQSLQNDKINLDNNQRALTKLQTLKQRALERESRRKRIEILKRKRPWLLYQQARRNFMDLKQKKDQIKSEFEAATIETNQEISLKIVEIESRLKDSAKKMKKFTKKVLENRNDVEKLQSEISHVALQIDGKKREILRERAMIQKTRNQYEADRNELMGIEKDYERISQEIATGRSDVSVEAADKEIRRLNEEKDEIEIKISNLTSVQQEIAARSTKWRNLEVNARTKMDEIKNVRSRRLDALSRLNPSTYAAYNWLQENKNQFQGEIIGPLAIEFNVKMDKMARTVESLISKSILVSFVCTNGVDFNNFMDVADRNNWRTNIIELGNYVEGTQMPKCPWAQKELKNLGFDCIVGDLLEGPEMALWTLCENAKTHLIPVSFGGNSNINVEACEKFRGLVKFASTESQFEIKRSRYNENDIAIRSVPLKPSFILSGTNSSDLPELQQKIDLARSNLQIEQENMREILKKLNLEELAMSRLKDLLNECHAQKNMARIKQAELKKLELNREKLRKSVHESLEFLKRQTDNEDSLNELTTLFRHKAELLENINKALKRLHESVQITCLEEMNRQIETLELQKLEKARNQLQGQHDYLRKQLESIEKDLSTAKEKAQVALQVAEMQEITSEIKEAFSEITDDLNVLEDEILAEEVQLNASGSGTGEQFGKNHMDELEQLIATIQNSDLRIQSAKKSIEELQNQMQEIGEIWRCSITENIRIINEKFVDFFDKISCRGEISLGIPEDVTNFDAYTLVIKVAFRASEDLQRLTGQRQSGGEKSVSTILYLLSLQELSRAPLRVVDEINQGMDVENERKVHALIVQAATNASTATRRRSQYFLITPKLLTGLEYHEKMHILCIFNGLGVPY